MGIRRAVEEASTLEQARMSSARWWSESTIAVVTGGNKGIGLQIVRKLAQERLTVVLTARNQQLGLDALAKLHSQGLLTVVFHPLDVLNQASISQLANWLNQHYNGLDILVNNAAIADAEPVAEPDLSSAQKVLDTNYNAVKAVTKQLLPLLRPSHAGARIVNVSSWVAQLKELKNPALREEIGTLNGLTEEKVDTFVEKYLHDVKEQNVVEKGWPSFYSAYSVSKVVLNAYTRVLAESLKDRPSGKQIYVNCVHPGHCKTDLSQNKGPLTAEEGAETPIWVALLPPDSPSGRFFWLKHEEPF